MNATSCAGCPDSVVIAMPDLTPYRAGDVLTCSSDGYPAPTYSWTVSGVDGSTANTQALQEGEHVYICTATVTLDNGETCKSGISSTVTAYGKYHKQCHTLQTILMLTTLFVF